MIFWYLTTLFSFEFPYIIFLACALNKQQYKIEAVFNNKKQVKQRSAISNKDQLI
jgi:hypothetical protein